MELFNTQEYSKILIEANIYTGFYKILKAITPLIIPMIIVAFMGSIPYLIISIVISAFFLFRYIKFKEKKNTRIFLTVLILAISIFFVVKAFSIYPLTNKYEIPVNKTVSEISNTEIKTLLERELKENYYVYKIEIYRGFPDDFNGYIKYKDIVSKERRFFLSDAENAFVENNSVDRTKEYAIKVTLLLLVGDITYIIFTIIIQDEFKKIAKKEENANIEAENYF